MATKFRLLQKAAAVDKAFKEMVAIAANDAQRQFKKSFYDEGFTDESFEHWKPRKGQIRSLGAKSIGRKTLTKTGALKRSIRISLRPGGYSARVFTVLPYAAIHNEGGTINQNIAAGARRHRSGDFDYKTEKSVRYDRKTGGRKSTFMRVRGSGVQFFKAHSRTIHMPKRKFLGASRDLERRTMAKMKAKINTAIKNA